MTLCFHKLQIKIFLQMLDQLFIYYVLFQPPCSVRQVQTQWAPSSVKPPLLPDIMKPH